MPLAPLPIDAHVDLIRDHLRRHRAVVVTAAPGAGKTTRVPPAVAAAGRVILLQPRRVAARAMARRIAEERGWTIGREVGWQIRFERRFSAETRLLVVTEGILTARLQQDPLLSDFATIVLDEFHERSIHADLGLALAKQAWLARDDLRIVVMSATLDSGQVARYLANCPVVDVPGTAHPLTIEHTPGTTVPDAVARLLGQTHGNVLCFLPGAREIDEAQRALAAMPVARDLEVLPLHGALDSDAQDRALAASSTRRRIVVATNIAETSLTVPGVSVVVDSGLHKVARYDAERGIDSLSLERITRDAADQRAGRAARLGPGVAVRLWDARDRLRPHREPEIARVDLSASVLDLLAWGATLDTFEWFDAPPAHRVEAALELLERLEAIEKRPPSLTPLGRRMQRLPIHPRLGRILIAGTGSARVAAACALLANPGPLPGTGVATECDLLPAIDRFASQPAHIRQVAHELMRLASDATDSARGADDDAAVRLALLAGYADRVARRRSPEGKFTLASGHGATLGRESGVRSADWLVALDVTAADRAGTAEAVIRAASQVEREWLSPTAVGVEHELDDAGRVRAFHVERYGAIELTRRPVKIDSTIAADLLAQAWLDRGPDEQATQLLRRIRFAELTLDLHAAVRQAAAGASTIAAIDLGTALPFTMTRDLASLAPQRLPVPSGRTASLVYEEDGSVSASVKLQELFGLAETPRLGPCRVPVTVHLLAPNGRPVQTTRDLRSFWERTYPEVRKELRGRYPKHPWPEDPWTATPTARAKPRR